jgi:hypothetical protein
MKISTGKGIHPYITLHLLNGVMSHRALLQMEENEQGDFSGTIL